MKRRSFLKMCGIALVPPLTVKSITAKNKPCDFDETMKKAREEIDRAFAERQKKNDSFVSNIKEIVGNLESNGFEPANIIVNRKALQVLITNKKFEYQEQGNIFRFFGIPVCIGPKELKETEPWFTITYTDPKE